jgi:hypothetical protein
MHSSRQTNESLITSQGKKTILHTNNWSNLSRAWQRTFGPMSSSHLDLTIPTILALMPGFNRLLSACMASRLTVTSSRSRKWLRQCPRIQVSLFKSSLRSSTSSRTWTCLNQKWASTATWTTICSVMWFRHSAPTTRIVSKTRSRSQKPKQRHVSCFWTSMNQVN